MAKDITEDFQYDLSYQSQGSSFQLTDVGYDVSLADIPFILKIDNQNPYRRETAPYKKDQFDNSPEPGEQSLTGWWVRSQTSWHNGAGIEFYEPGTDYEHVSHRFYDSRGVDIWTVGELRLLKAVTAIYESANGNKINAATGYDVTNNKEVLISGDDDGYLKRITLNGNSTATAEDYYNGSTYPEGHNGSNYDFLSVTTDGSNYYAACSRAIHTGLIETLSSDEVAFNFSNSDKTNVFIKYVKGSVLFGLDNGVYNMTSTSTSLVARGTRTTSSHNHSGGTDSLPTGNNVKLHLNPLFVWNDSAGSPSAIYLSGNGGNNGEIWKVLFDDTTNLPDMAGATMVLSLPDGETVKAIHYYLGYLAVGTSKGVRICTIYGNNNLVMGPLLIESSYAINGFSERGSYLYAATTVVSGGNTNGILIRIDLSQQFDDGTFAYAYDLEYQSNLNGNSSQCTEVYNLEDRMIMVIEENNVSGKLKAEHTTNYRSSGYLQTGKIRYGTVEPKFFKYLQTRGLIPAGDSVSVKTIDNAGNEYDIITLDSISMGQNVTLGQPKGSQEFIALKFVLNNSNPLTNYPVMQSYQVKSIPGVVRQRLYQYPLSCYDIEMDRFNSQFGYIGRAFDVIKKLEELEGLGNFITVKDYRTDENFQGIIEEVRFINESSPDKDSNGYGGLLLVLIRRLA
jgi:hypothetical protein